MTVGESFFFLKNQKLKEPNGTHGTHTHTPPGGPEEGEERRGEKKERERGEGEGKGEGGLP